MDAVVAAVVTGAVAPFLVLAWILRRGPSGGKVRSFAERKDSGRDVDTHAVHDPREAAETAREALEERARDGSLVHRLLSRRRDE